MADPPRRENGELAEPKDTTLLSASTIGSPEAFSTAIKPPNGSVFSAQQATADSSLMTQDILPHLSRSQTTVSGRLSLESAADESNHTASLEEDSIAILDLDALQDSSEGLNLFLSGTTASTIQQLPPSSHHAPPPPTSSRPQATPPLLEPTSISNAQRQDSSYAVSAQEDHSNADAEGLIPQKFLERSSSSVSSSTVGSSRSSFDGSEDDNDGDSFEGETLELAREDGKERDAFLQQQLDLGAELSLPANFSSPPSSVREDQRDPSTVSPPARNGQPYEEDRPLQLQDLDPSSLPPPPTSSSSTSSSSSPPRSHNRKEQAIDNGGDDTLIGDEVEMTMMFEAAVLSQYHPAHLAASVQPTSVSLRVEPAPAGGIKDDSRNASSYNEGLPSLYLAASTTPSETTQLELSDHAPSVTSPAHPPPPSGSSTATTSLEGSLVELAGSLGTSRETTPMPKPDVAMETSRESTVVPESDVSMETTRESAFVRETHTGRFSSGMYNPFDSEDDGDAGEGFEELQFGEQSSGVFLQQLAQDEQEVESANLFATTPPSAQLPLFSEEATSGWLTASGGEQLSISSYFQQRSHGLGALGDVKLPPSMRPHFSSSKEHVIQSPADLPVTTPTLTEAPPPIAGGDGDETLVASDEEQKEEEEKEEEGEGTLSPTVATMQSKVPATAVDSLTPVVTSHTPFPAHVPKLDLANTSTISFSTAPPPPPSTTLPPPHTHTARASKQGEATELPSQYWRASETYSSTLVFPDLTALGLSSPPPPPPPRSSSSSELTGLESIATPSSLQLSVGQFEMTADDSIFGSLRTKLAPPETVKRKSAPLSDSSVSQSVTTSYTLPSHHTQLQQDIDPSAEETLNPLSSSSSPEGVKTPPKRAPNVVTSASAGVALEQPSSRVGGATSPPSTELARKKLAELQAVLNTTRFDADKFLASLGAKSSSPSIVRETGDRLKTKPASPAATVSDHLPGTTAGKDSHLVQLASASTTHTGSRRDVQPSPLKQDASLVISSPPSHQLTSPYKPIYTSPLARPYTTSFSPSPTKKQGNSPGVSPSKTPEDALRVSPISKRSKVPEPDSLKVADSLCFQTVCCVGASLADQLVVTNSGSRWLQLSFSLSQLYNDGSECSLEKHSVFLLPQRCFVGPQKSEPVKVTFLPPSPGSYEALLSVHARLVVTSSSDSETEQISSSVILKALAEEAHVDVAAGGVMDRVMDFGVLVGGCSVSLPLTLTNLGLSSVPLQLAVRTSTLSQLCFKFGEIPEALVCPSPPSHPHFPHTLTLTLPPKQATGGGAPPTIDLHFTAPKKILDDSYDPGPPDEISAQIEVTVDGPNRSAVPMATVPIRAVVGVARLHVPKPLQALSFSCAAGQTTTRDIPFKNAGNIPLQVRMKVPALFSVNPASLTLEPAQEALVSVSYSPPSAPLSSEGLLLIRVEPNGPNYELSLRGTAMPTSQQQQPREEEEEGATGGMLSCSRRSLYWGGVQLNHIVQQKLMLHNSFPYTVNLQLSIRHPDTPFQLQALPATGQVPLLPDEQMAVHVTFSPPGCRVWHSAVDILDLTHDRKYRIPVCGYGGSGQLEVLNCRRSQEGGNWIDLGQVAGQPAAVKLTVYNAGLRDLFVQATCYKVKSVQPLPPSQASVTPSHFVLGPRQTRELSLLYQPSPSDELLCHAFATPLATVELVSGDELARQRLLRALSTSEARASLRNPANASFLAPFLGQEKAESDLELGLFQVADEEQFFEQHLSTTVVSLAGSSASKTGLTSKTLSSPPPPRPSSSENQKLRLKLSPSHTPLRSPPHHPHTSPSPSSHRHILSSHTLTLPDTAIGHYSEKALEIHNPCDGQPLTWRLGSAASPFVRETVRDSGDIFKANYSVFWVSERTGIIPPSTTAKVLVIFQPHDEGSFSQLWDLFVSRHGAEEERLRVSFGGRAGSTLAPKPTSSADIHPGVSMATDHASTATVRHSAKLTPPRKSVYIKDEAVEFPPTRQGSKSTVKVRVCNRDALSYKFDVIRPSPPFTVEHLSFELGSRQCARLPVHFNPLQAGRYDGVVAVRTNAGHQAFAVLHGNATE